MPSLAHQRILVAATGVLVGLFLIPNSAESVQESWVDLIARRVQVEHDLASREPVSSGYERYLTQLQSPSNRPLCWDMCLLFNMRWAVSFG